MKQVRLTARAELDLEEVGDYIAADNPALALAFVQAIREHCERIANAPLGYPTHPELGENLRSCPHGRYRIFFQPRAADVLIVRILHGARDFDTLFPDFP
ncbi:MAG: type II toxin-antitoxin system RelE/ParE family toxin [Gammaproteobacteria bacterium]|nr:type II toxin-antitoxin system RelE/ParE family toxin [Gammaproteobacteria bacterium]MBK8133092.1 type II toxin-antitoxin system RelE/ParE family toxin [Gammaproteobacteria bacterium]MBK9428883.1 type II toxin-antitoxin system RelE/ParE family toxin [Gammaproteobacteria bacterium]